MTLSVGAHVRNEMRAELQVRFDAYTRELETLQKAADRIMELHEALAAIEQEMQEYGPREVPEPEPEPESEPAAEQPSESPAP